MCHAAFPTPIIHFYALKIGKSYGLKRSCSRFFEDYAKDTKIFDKHGLNVEIIQMRSDLQLAGLASGEVDYTPSIGPAGAAFANGMPVKAVAVLYHAPLFALVSPPAIASVKDLEGKKVAVSRIGSESHRYGSLMIESGGADPKKVTFIQTGSTTVR